MYKLIYRDFYKQKEYVLAKGKRDIFDSLKTWSELHFYRNGRIYAYSDAQGGKTFTKSRINSALKYIGGIVTMPDGIRAVYEIIQ